MRGTPSPVDPRLCRPRFIPAHAGNTPATVAGPDRRSVHPRACGEHRGGVSWAILDRGSSPRMRGTLASATNVLRVYRFIPAHAGNTAAPNTRLFYDNGSSPRMRGTRPQVGLVLARHRFIPAHAGNTRPGRPSPGPGAAGSSPRMRGTRVRRRLRCSPGHGSSPRMRGTHADIALDAHAAGGSGSSPRMRGTPCALRWATTVHPRACGEHGSV